jgi:hypothetical protein
MRTAFWSAAAAFLVVGMLLGVYVDRDFAAPHNAWQTRIDCLWGEP